MAKFKIDRQDFNTMSSGFNADDLFGGPKNGGGAPKSGGVMSKAKAKKNVIPWVKTKAWIYRLASDNEDFEGQILVTKQDAPDLLLLQSARPLIIAEQIQVVFNIGKPVMAVCVVEQQAKAQVRRIMPFRDMFNIRLRVKETSDLPESPFSKDAPDQLKVGIKAVTQQSIPATPVSPTEVAAAMPAATTETPAAQTPAPDNVTPIDPTKTDPNKKAA